MDAWRVRHLSVPHVAKCGTRHRIKVLLSVVPIQMSESKPLLSKEVVDEFRRERISTLFYFNRYSLLLTLVSASLIGWFIRDAVPREQALGWWAGIFSLTLFRMFLGWRFSRQKRSLAQSRQWERAYLTFTVLNGMLWGALALPVMDMSLELRTVIFLILLAITAFSLFPNMPALPAYIAMTMPINVAMLVGAYQRLVISPDLVMLIVAVYMPACIIAARRMALFFREMVGARLQFKRLSEAAEAANAAKSVFLSSMSHEMRTPLNVVLGYAQLVVMDKQINPEARDNAAEIEKAGRHLLALVNDILDLARIEAGRVEMNIEDVGLAEVLADCQRFIEPLALEQGLVLEIPQTRVVVHADRLRLQQVLLNLLSNAVKYNHPGGRVSMRGDIQPRGRYRIAITDTGPGIAAERMGSLFQAFNRMGAEMGVVQGTGIGLVISRNLIELMGGTIGVESVEGAGCTFWVELPLASPLAGA